MRPSLDLLLALPLAANAYPGLMDAVGDNTLVKRGKAPTVPPPKFKSGRDQCGVHGPCAGFSEKDQFVDVRDGTAHEFRAPGPNDKRGECPGLNAAANHGFLPRNGIATIAQTAAGLGAAYNMAPDLSAGLAVISIALIGDPVAGTWSIGGSYPSSSLGLLGQPKGILGSHNRYEGDASIVRDDAYLAGGNVNNFLLQKWNYLYSLVGDSLTQDDAAKMAYWTSQYSVINNPEYFSGPFTGLVAPDAHNFVTNMMSNHSAAVPGGTLDGETLKSFFAVTGSPGSFVHHPGQERIPYNWYRRPTANAFTVVDTNADTVINNQIYPGVIKFGGNTGKVNTFTGVDLGNLTGGAYNAQNLGTGNNAACFFYQASQQAVPDFGAPLVQPLNKVEAFLTKNLGPYISKLGCPKLSGDAFGPGLFKPFPGAKYNG